MTCRVEKCERTRAARGWCEAHYRRWKRHGDPLSGGALRQPGRLCSAGGCQKPHEARGYCAAHYAMLRKHGDPSGGTRHYSNAEDAFQARTSPAGDCLLWTGATGPLGYGTIRVSGTCMAAHRYAWERKNGAIPPGAEIDHICWNPSCCNVKHLRLASPAENNRYRKGAQSTSSTGVRGVRFLRGKYRARMAIDGVTRQIGSFDALGDAEAALVKAREEHYADYAGGSRNGVDRSI